MCSGSVINCTPIRLIAGGIVAENNNVWRWSGTAFKIDSMSSKNPMFNISSASSKTKVLTFDKLIVPRLMWSIKRPGVPTTMWAPWLKPLIWRRISAPPKTACTLTRLSRPNLNSSSCVWIANSRVGETTSACTWLLSVSIMFKIGNPKAAVLPVPVWAWPITSLPAKVKGIVCSWIGVAST